MSKQILTGIVVSNACDKTVHVRVQRDVLHPIYHKKIVRTAKYAVHDESNQYKVGDVVSIMESRPISKTKKWVVVN